MSILSMGIVARSRSSALNMVLVALSTSERGEAGIFSPSRSLLPAMVCAVTSVGHRHRVADLNPEIWNREGHNRNPSATMAQDLSRKERVETIMGAVVLR